jgi:hypothetical protein
MIDIGVGGWRSSSHSQKLLFKRGLRTPRVLTQITITRNTEYCISADDNDTLVRLVLVVVVVLGA